MTEIARKETRAVKADGVTIGGGAPVVIQSMTSTKTTDLPATLGQIERLIEAGCELVRVAVPDREALAVLPDLVKSCPLPLVADIHFDHELALGAIEAGCAKIRINPGNIGGTDKLVSLVRQAEKRGAAIRIGVNAGSLERDLLKKYGGPGPEALVESALRYLAVLEGEKFFNTVVSLKASDVYTTIRAYRLFSDRSPAPLHLGVTEAGPLLSGSIKSAIGIGSCLADGIGDTIRVSLTAPPEEEVAVAKQILQALGIRRFGPDLVSCPTCGRCEVDLQALVAEVEKLLAGDVRTLKIAVMGCSVNGPGEAKEADLGISAGKKKGLLFRRGQVIRTVEQQQLLQVLAEELRKI